MAVGTILLDGIGMVVRVGETCAPVGLSCTAVDLRRIEVSGVAALALPATRRPDSKVRLATDFLSSFIEIPQGKVQN